LKFDQDFIEKVREASNIIDVIGAHIELRRSGGGFVGLCPFHGEKTASFSVSEDKQVYHCFGCKASGNVYGFVQQYQGLTFPETVEFLARRAGIPIPEKSKQGSDEDKEKKTTLYRINEVAAKFFQYELQKLKDDSAPWQYLKTRGITREFAEKHRLGFAPDSWSSLSAFFDTKRAPLYLAATLGLVKARNSGQGYYDLFRNRIIFPIYSPTEQCLGFGGRVLDASMPKYLNSPDSPIFHKGHVFYGLDKAAKHIRTADTAILVEGYTDWLALEKAGFLNVVATLGTAFTHNHARLLTRYCANVIVLFDGDEAGQLAARRSLSILLEAGLYPKGITLPFELDPDEFIEEHGAQALKHSIEKAQDLYDLIVEQEVRGHSGEPSEKIQILDRLAPLLEAVQDVRLRELYIQNTAQFLNIDAKLVRASLRAEHHSSASKPPPQRQPAPQTSVQPPQGVAVPDQKIEIIEVLRPPRVEQDLLNLSLMKETYLEEILGSGIVPKLLHRGVQQVLELVQEAYGQGHCKFDNLTSLLVTRVKPAEIVTLQLGEPFSSLTDETARKFIHDCLRRIEENHRKAQAKALMSNLRGAQGENKTEAMEQFMNIQRSRRQHNQEN